MQTLLKILTISASALFVTACSETYLVSRHHHHSHPSPRVTTTSGHLHNAPRHSERRLSQRKSAPRTVVKKVYKNEDEDRYAHHPTQNKKRVIVSSTRRLA